jgi:hypothetical protein
METDQHNPDECLDPTCRPCLDDQRHESVVRLELLLLDAELRSPNVEWVESNVTADALDLRNVLDLLRGV